MASVASGSACVLLALTALLVPASSQAASGTPDLRVVTSDSSGLLLELRTPVPRVESERAADGRTYDRLRVPGWGTTNVPGDPELPARSFLIQVPAAGEVDVEIEEAAVHVRRGLAVKPVALPRVGGGDVDSALIARDGTPPIFAGLQPTALFDLSPRALLRRVPVMRLTLHPFRWNPATGDLRIAGRMAVRVRFHDALPAASAGEGTSQDPFAPVWEEGVVNPPAAGWSPAIAAAGSAPVVPAGATGLRMEIRRDGMYRVTGADLRAAGVAIDTVDPRTIRVVAGGREAAVRVVSRLGRRMRARDFVEFYAQRLTNAFTDANVYWLVWNGKRGQRIAASDGSVAEGSEVVASFPQRLRFEENHKTWDAMPGAPEQDFWFWEGLQAPKTVSHTLDIPAPAVTAAQARLRIALRGHTTGSHRVRVLLNGGNLIGEDRWAGTEEHLFDATFAQTLLAAGANGCTIELPGGDGLDQIFVNWIEVDYERESIAVADDLRLTIPGAAVDRMVQVDGFSQPGLRVFDVTDPFRPLALAEVEVTPSAAGHRVRFGVGPGGARSFQVLADTALRTPSGIEYWRARRLRPAGGADYILITPRQFLPATRPLRRLRRDQGLRVRAVAVEDIFNTYSGGLPYPEALKDFLRDAYRNWRRPAPSYVFLLGDASIDYRDFLGSGKKSRVPAHLSPTTGLSVTPDDNWYAAVDGDDDLPDLFIGRVSVGSAEAAAAAVAKIVAYERAPRPAAAEALFVADNNEPSFQELAERLSGLLPEKIAPRRLYLTAYTDFALAKMDLRSAIGDGMLVTTYAGHGDVTGWAGERILDTTTAQLLDNTRRLTFVVTLDCLSGYFAQSSDYSLGELLANMPGAGAIAAFAPSGLGYTWEQALLGEELFPLLFKAPRLRLGRISAHAKVLAYGRGATIDIVKTFTLLGDPATRLATPR